MLSHMLIYISLVLWLAVVLSCFVVVFEFTERAVTKGKALK